MLAVVKKPRIEMSLRTYGHPLSALKFPAMDAQDTCTEF